MQYKHFIGIDVSKETLDICVMANQSILAEFKISNDDKSLSKILRQTKAIGLKPESSLWCMENTGIYSNLLLCQLCEKDFKLWLENPMQIKRSLGIHRGKNDKVDAQRIAKYAFKNCMEAKIAKPKNITLVTLKNLCNLRENLLKSKINIQKPIKELSRFVSKDIAKTMELSCKKSIVAIENDILNIEKRMMKTINDDPELKILFSYIVSVEGIGLHTGIAFLIYTGAFKDFTCPKKFACYSGVVPFEQQSGSSLKTKARVSHLANIDMKRLLHMAALTSLKMKKSELNLYYRRKVEEGKNPMTVLNAMRNKLIHRVFACVRGKRNFEKRIVELINN